MIDRICTITLCDNTSDENYSSIPPKNATHVLWRNINTAEQFKMGGVTDKKDDQRGNSSTAPLEALSSLWPQRVGGQCHCRAPPETPISTETTLMLALMKRVWQVSFLRFKTVSNRAKFKKNSRGYENIQLSAGDESCLQVHFTGYTMVQRDPWSGRRPLCLASSVICCKKKKKKDRVCVLHYCQDKIQKRQSTGGLKDTTYKYQAVPDHPATATQLPY